MQYFEQLRLALCSSHVLILPNFTKPFFMDPDALDIAVGAVLLQQYDDRLHFMQHSKKKYFPAERNYCPIKSSWQSSKLIKNGGAI